MQLLQLIPMLAMCAVAGEEGQDGHNRMVVKVQSQWPDPTYIVAPPLFLLLALGNTITLGDIFLVVSLPQ